MILPEHISACLITKDLHYPEPIWDHIRRIGFGEILCLTRCESPHRKQELFQKAKHEFIYYQDDDCIAPIETLLKAATPDIITCAMKRRHLESYATSRIALLGWGAIFPRRVVQILQLYRDRYGEDQVYRRETERIMTYLCWPQQRLELPIVDLPSAWASDRLSMQPGHYEYIRIVEERCAALISSAVVE